MPFLRIKNLSVSAGRLKILTNINLNLAPGQILALVGPNGSGKSTLAQTLMGNPSYRVTHGSVTLGRKNILKLKPEQRAQAGFFLAFQNPLSFSGLSSMGYLRTVYNNRLVKAGLQPVSLLDFDKLIKPLAVDLGLSAILKRDLNEDFSGGEKKRMEALQMAILRPKLAIIDEIDSGLDIDSFWAIKTLINRLKRQGAAFIIISHYTKLLRAFKPDKVLIMSQGEIVKNSDSSLLTKIDRLGFKRLLKS
ncbi:MAG: Fe-S cluster assembly ATPase SufC [Patescibacteria group bacterium]